MSDAGLTTEVADGRWTLGACRTTVSTHRIGFWQDFGRTEWRMPSRWSGLHGHAFGQSAILLPSSVLGRGHLGNPGLNFYPGQLPYIWSPNPITSRRTHSTVIFSSRMRFHARDTVGPSRSPVGRREVLLLISSSHANRMMAIISIANPTTENHAGSSCKDDTISFPLAPSSIMHGVELEIEGLVSRLGPKCTTREMQLNIPSRLGPEQMCQKTQYNLR